jgi:hypothetical protein
MSKKTNKKAKECWWIEEIVADEREKEREYARMRSKQQKIKSRKKVH